MGHGGAGSAHRRENISQKGGLLMVVMVVEVVVIMKVMHKNGPCASTS